jgi:hypothetical protein
MSLISLLQSLPVISYYLIVYGCIIVTAAIVILYVLQKCFYCKGLPHDNIVLASNRHKKLFSITTLASSEFHLSWELMAQF